MKVSVLINSRNRLQPLIRCLKSVFNQNYSNYEIVVLDDASDSINLCQALLEVFKCPFLRCFRSDTQLGVAGSRNLLMRLATGQVFCFIDDDACFESPEALTRFVKAFSVHKDIGIVACKVVNHCGNNTDLLVPFSRRWRRHKPNSVEEGQFVSYYLGTCHSIRREVFEHCGPYKDDMIFGGEELDLSYRAINAGYYIYYEPSIIVHHYPQTSVVGPGDQKEKNAKELYYSLRNRYYLAYRYLPLQYMPSYLAVWTGYYFWEALRLGHLSAFLRALWDGIWECRKNSRDPLNKQAQSYLTKHYGRLWY